TTPFALQLQFRNFLAVALPASEPATDGTLTVQGTLAHPAGGGARTPPRTPAPPPLPPGARPGAPRDAGPRRVAVARRPRPRRARRVDPPYRRRRRAARRAPPRQGSLRTPVRDRRDPPRARLVRLPGTAIRSRRRAHRLRERRAA